MRETWTVVIGPLSTATMTMTARVATTAIVTDTLIWGMTMLADTREMMIVMMNDVTATMIVMMTAPPVGITMMIGTGHPVCLQTSLLETITTRKCQL